MSPQRLKKDLVVISSAGHDAEFAHRLKEALSDIYEVWYYKDSMPVEHNGWDEKIDEALKKARFFIGVLSSASVKSEYVRQEWRWAVTEGKHNHGLIFMTVQAEPADPGHLYGGYTWTDFYNRPFDVALAELRSRMRHALRRKITAAVDAVSNTDPHRTYLRTLWSRISTMLHHLIISSLEADPIDLEMDSVDDVVDDNARTQPFVDLMFKRIGYGEEFATLGDAFAFYERRLLLLGMPGSGKTVTGLMLIRDAILDRLDNPDAPIPILANIQSWDGRTPLVDWLNSYPYTPRDTIDLAESGKALIFFDGLDELSDHTVMSSTEDPYRIHRQFMAQIPRNCPVLVTCRNEDYERIRSRIPLNGGVLLSPLNNDQIRRFLGRVPELFELVQDDPDLMNMMRTPLIASLFAFTCERMSPENRDRLINNKNNAQLFREELIAAYIMELYKFERRRRPENTLPVPVLRLMEALGRVAMRNAANFMSRTNLLSEGDLNLLSANVEERRKIKETALQLGLLQRVSTSRYKFIHLMVRDTLAFYYSIKHWREPSEYMDRYWSPALALGRIKDPRATRVLRTILKEVQSAIVRRHVAQAFGYNNDRKSVPDLVKLLADPEDDVQAAAVESLGAIGDPSAFDYVLPLLRRSTSPAVLQNACRALGAFGDTRAVEYLIDMLNNEHVSVVQQAALALAQLRATQAAPALRKKLSTPEHGATSTVIEVLGRLNDGESVSHLVRLLSTETANKIQDCIVDALRRIASPDAVPALCDKLASTEERSPDFRAKVAEALGAIGDTRAIPMLLEAITKEVHEATYSYNAMREALLKLGHTNIPEPEYFAEDVDSRLNDTNVEDLIDISPNVRWDAADDEDSDTDRSRGTPL
ncbi:MAG: HEAT repeat domain-containing protein [Chloroflexi bacterium]|nr:HEAT repeat domain-containing protein [Chloroflexota bacterium]